MSQGDQLAAKRYYTGKPCPRGHICQRYVSTRACVDCAAENCRKRDIEKARAYTRSYRKSEKYADYLDRTRQDRVQKALARAKANPEAVRAAKRKWNHANSHLWRSYYATHTQRCRRAMPSWITKEQRAEMLALYREASERQGGPWEVDHIVPLKGKDVSGLHVPWNLRIVPASENRSKGARLIADLAEQPAS